MQGSRTELEDYRWLVSDAAQRYLAEAAAAGKSTSRMAKRLRSELSAARSRLVLQQVELRRRANAKFSAASTMFFTGRLLEQSTDELVAEYKASRFSEAGSVTDFCCGIGGDLRSLSRSRLCLGVDQDPLAALLARANCWGGDRQAATVVADANRWSPASGCWHLDPDRRVGQKRVTRLDECQPGLATIERLRAALPQGAVKLAAATQVPSDWHHSEREWIGSRGECRQQVVWFGRLAGNAQRTATVVSGREVGGYGVAQISGSGDEEIPRVFEPEAVVLEPHPTVLAAGLVGALAIRHQLACFSPVRGYLTASNPVDDPLLSSFAVEAVLPLDVKKIAALLRSRGVGQLELKRRGMPLDLVRFRKQLKLRGEGKAVLILVVDPGASMALLARRL